MSIRKRHRRSDKPIGECGDPALDVERRSEQLSDLLKVYRELSTILNPRELYAAITDIVYARLAVNTLGLFRYDPQTQMFELNYRHGLKPFTLRLPQGEGLWWEAILAGEPFSIRDGQGDAKYPEPFEEHGLDRLRSDLWVPLVIADEVIGFLTLGHAEAGVFDDFARFFLREFASHAAVCIRTSQLYRQRQREKEDLDKTLQNLSLLHSIGKAMNYIGDLKKLLQYILSQAVEVASAEKGSIMLYDMETDRLKIRVLAGMQDSEYQDKVNNNEVECRSFRPGEGIAGRVFLTAKPIVANNILKDELFIESESSFVRSIACIPMVVYSDVIGVINVTNKRGGQRFTDEDVAMLRAVADQAAVAVNKAQLWDMAVTDSLTGLFVRRYFMMKLQDEVIRAERYRKKLSVIMADLDRFKRINDTYGHDAGDLVLKSIGPFFQKNIRDVDTVARYGGEEFVVLLPDADKEAAFSLAERLRRSLARLRLENLPQITMSLGVATYPADGTGIESLIKKADAAMYAAKQEGRNRTARYGEDIKLVRETSP